MVCGDGRDHWFVKQVLLFHVRIFNPQAAKADIDLAGFQGFHLLPGFQFVQHDFQVLVLPQPAHHQRQLAVEHRGHEADGEQGFPMARNPTGVVNGGVDLVQHLLGLLQKVFAPGGQLQTPRFADE